jgi:peroxiredoxin
MPPRIVSTAASSAQFGLRFRLPDYLREIYRTCPLDFEKFNGDPSWTLPIPARFLIDQQGIIRAAESDPDYTTRPEPDDTLQALRAISRR